MSDNSVFEDFSVDFKAMVSQCGCSDSEINSSPKEKPSETQHAFLQIIQKYEGRNITKSLLFTALYKANYKQAVFLSI